MLKDILAISGQPGLFKLVAQNQKGIIVESLDNQKRIPIYQTTKVSALEDIAIYTYDEEVPLTVIFEKMYKIENKSVCSVAKNASNNEIKEYFEDIVAEYDKDRVYISDMKKVLNWYNILVSKDMLSFDQKVEEASSSEDAKLDETKPKTAKTSQATQVKNVQKKQSAPKTPKAPAAQKKSVPVKK